MSAPRWPDWAARDSGGGAVRPAGGAPIMGFDADLGQKHVNRRSKHVPLPKIGDRPT